MVKRIYERREESVQALQNKIDQAESKGIGSTTSLVGGKTPWSMPFEEFATNGARLAGRGKSSRQGVKWKLAGLQFERKMKPSDDLE